MDSEVIIKTLVSNKNNTFELKISNNNENIKINIERKGKMLNEYFNLNLSINDFHKLNNYFSKYLTSKELKDKLNKIINSSSNLFEKKNELILKITLPTNSKNEISLLIKKNIENYPNNLKKVMNELDFRLENIKLEKNNIKIENMEIIEQMKKLNTNFFSLKLSFNNLKSEINKFENKLSEFQKKYYFKKNNFHWINKEVTITKNSKFFYDYSPEILLGKNKQKNYYLSDGNKNHFIEFSFDKIYYLKSIKIKIADFDSSLKSFTIDIIDEKENQGNVGFFIMNKYEFNNGCQEFKIERGCKKVLLNLINNWGNNNYIQIARIDFFVSE